MIPKEFMFSVNMGSVFMLIFTSFISLFSWIYMAKSSNREKQVRVITNGVIVFLLIVLAFILSYLNFYSSVNNLYDTTLQNNLFAVVFILFTIFAIISAKDFLPLNIKYGELYFLLIMLVVGSILLISSNNLLSTFVYIELISLSLYGLVGFNKTNFNIESSIKYYILGSFASVFMFFSLVLIYISAGSFDMKYIFTNYMSFPNSDLFILGIILFMSGFIFKLALVPFHSWAVDVYQGSPTFITSVMVSVVKIAVVITLYRLFIGINHHLVFKVFYIFIILTMIIPNLIALKNTNVKRIIVYSSISHAGYIALSFMGPEQWQAYFYVIIYAIASFGAFSVLLSVEKNEIGPELNEIKGLYHRSPLKAVSLALFLFSLAGVPPLSGFFAKFYAFYNAVAGGYTDLVIIAVITSAISLYYYLKILIPAFMEDSDDENWELKKSYNNDFVVFIFAVLTLIAGICSPCFMKITNYFI